MKTVTIGNYSVGDGKPLLLISGPCQIETRDHAFYCAETLASAAEKAGMNFVYKSSFDKANRTSMSAARGAGIEEGLRILADVKAEFNCPVLTDIHLPEQCAPVAEVCDILQIPAFLCRQTDLIVAAARTGAVVNIKKGQFLAPWDMKHVAAKAVEAGNEQLLLTERGTSFGYNTLVSDFRGLPQMASFGFPVIFDATHSVAQPGGLGGASGGQREFVSVLARAAVAVGVQGLFMESHQDPDNAPSDGPNMVPISDMPDLLGQLARIHQAAQ
ncbi:MAG: 3-deoxy-8-phosphooctulonate synthase [Candidatus Puniceispirillaceae bacterium]|jgi:2-dehydro-3-deoxyphosphooctonate aldolase (KDO 8-P synthase)|nr:3-deoxy-8-phosphooctulonate synthase [Pseudomonadota bacterium]